MSDDLVGLRADVEALRDEASGKARVVGFAEASPGTLAELNQHQGAVALATRVLDLIDQRTADNGRPIVKTIRVQPGLAVLVEDSHNVLIDITTPNGRTSLARSGAVTNIDRLIQALEFAREWVAIEEANR